MQTVQKYYKDITKGQIVIAAIFSFLLSQAIVAGTRVHYVQIRAGYAENFISYDLACVGTGLLLGGLLFPVILLLFELQRRFGMKGFVREDDSTHHSLRFFLIAWSIIFVCWLPYLLTFYPGGLVGDGIEVVRMAVTPGFPTSSHWSPLYALILKVVIHLGGLAFDSLNDCLYLYAVLESIAFSGVCAYLCLVLRRRFPQIRILSVLSVALFALSGFFASYGMTFWADGIFGALIVLMCIQLWDGIHAGRFSMPVIVRLSFIELFLCLWRNNGIYIVVFVLAGMLILLKKDALWPTIAGLAVIAAVLIITGPVYTALGVSKDTTRESISIPLQQMAAAINSDYELSPEQEEVLYAVAPEEVWRGNYCPTLSDDIKFKLDQAYLDEHLGGFLKVWAELLVPNFGTYVRAYLMQTIGFWKLNSFQGNYWDYWYGVEDNYNYGLYEKDLLEEATGVSIKPFLVRCTRFISSGAVVWIMLFSFFSILYQRKERQRLLVLLPLTGCWLTVMIATPIAFAYRYVFALAMALPMVVFLPMYHTGKHTA